MMLYCDECGGEVDYNDAANVKIGDGEKVAVICPDCHEGRLDADRTVEIDGGVKCQNCYSVLFDLKEFVWHVSGCEDCTRFTHRDEVVLDVAAHTELCHSCAAANPENEYHSPLTGEEVQLCDDCIKEIVEEETEEASQTPAGDDDA